MKTVSVIVPAYNASAFLEETICSILASTYPALEVVIVDDGSSDNTFALANNLASTHAQVRTFSQLNSGVSAARNRALREAVGTYILPVDADDLISTTYIANAVAVLDARSEVKVVYAKAEFFGLRQGAWNLPTYSLHKLAMHNQIYVSAMYRKEDALAFGGYCETISGREDWEFWMSMLKTGGEVVQLSEIGLFYRIQKQSKRVSDRQNKAERIALLNERHLDFFLRELHGPLRHRRSMSPVINRVVNVWKSTTFRVTPAYNHFGLFVARLNHDFSTQGSVLYQKRNVLKRFIVGNSSVVVKAFKTPSFFKSIIYGWFRKSKAKRSFEYAVCLQQLGIGTPAPIGYLECRTLGCLTTSYYASAESTCKHTFNDLIGNPTFPFRTEILTAIGEFTARLHEAGIRHQDYSGGNILFEYCDGKVAIELIDLNRLKFGKVNLLAGCRNFERLNIDADALRIMAKAYALARDFDVQLCSNSIIQMRWKKHVKQQITNL